MLLQCTDPYRFACPIKGFTLKTLTRTKLKELDQWVSTGQRNVELFEELTGKENRAKQEEWYQMKIDKGIRERDL